MQARDVDAARRQKSGAAFEQVERRVERNAGIARKRAQIGGGFIGIASDREEPLDQAAGLRRQRGTAAERRMLEETIGDLADGAPADRADAGDRQEIGDERVRGVRIGAGKRGKHALIFGPGLRGVEHQPVEIVLEAAGAVEILHQAPLPGRRQLERRDQRGEQADVAQADFRGIDAVMGGRLEAERQHLGIGGRDVAPAERFDAGLEEFAFAVGAMAEHLAEIAEAFRLAGGRRREIVARHRDGEVGAQTKLAAGRVGRKIHAPANVLAREVEERFGRLEQRGLGAAIARALVMGDEGLRPSIRPKLRCALCLAHDVTYAALLAHDQFRKPVLFGIML